ncbi:AroM family protein [Paraglaciecola sp. 2405UD69-4]|uniref:AroM family protein n=1 Tax=Paraglaciecola sp. 2405UD69-4 TaxID=3391836 RepID=UPI0039C928FB
MKSFTLGILTLGQAPREDIVPTFQAILGGNTNYVQAGALDGLSLTQIAELKTNNAREGIETRLLGGDSVLVQKQQLIDKLKLKATQLATRCDISFLLCSGRFPELKQSHPFLLQPIDYLKPIVKSAATGRCLCIIGPESDMEMAPSQWRECAGEVVTAAASPYDHFELLAGAAKRAKAIGADIIFMDDMGFTETQRQLVRTVSGVSTINATSLFARIIEEIR